MGKKRDDAQSLNIADVKKHLDMFLKKKNDAWDVDFSKGKNDSQGYSGSLESSREEFEGQLTRVKIASKQYDGTIEREDIIREYISGGFYKLLLKDVAPEIQLIHSVENIQDNKLKLKDDQFAISSGYISGFNTLADTANVKKYSFIFESEKEIEEIKKEWIDEKWNKYKDNDLFKYKKENLKSLNTDLYQRMSDENKELEQSPLLQTYKDLQEKREYIANIERYNPEIIKNYEEYLAKSKKFDGLKFEKIENLEKVVSAFVFMGDVDPNPGNLGIVQQEDGSFMFAKIDHGRSAVYFYENENHLRQQLKKIYIDHYKYDKLGMGLNIAKLHDAVSSTLEQISDDQIEQFLGSRVSNLKDSGVLLDQWSEKLTDQGIKKQDKTGLYPDSNPKFDSPDSCYEFYCKNFKEQRKVMAEFHKTLGILKELTPWEPKENYDKFVSGGWLSELGSEDPIIWAKKNNKTFGQHPGKDPFDWAEEKNFQIKIVIDSTNQKYSKPLLFEISSSNVIDGKINLKYTKSQLLVDGYAEQLTKKIKEINNPFTALKPKTNQNNLKIQDSLKTNNLDLLKTTSLIDACILGDRDLVTKALLLGGVATEKNRQGQTAFDIICNKEFTDDNKNILDLLINDSDEIGIPIEIYKSKNMQKNIEYIEKMHWEKVEEYNLSKTEFVRAEIKSTENNSERKPINYQFDAEIPKENNVKAKVNPPANKRLNIYKGIKESIVQKKTIKAIKSGNLEEVNHAIKKGINLNGFIDNNQTFLDLALKKGDLKIVNVLRQSGAHLHAPTKESPSGPQETPNLSGKNKNRNGPIMGA